MSSWVRAPLHFLSSSQIHPLSEVIALKVYFIMSVSPFPTIIRGPFLRAGIDFTKSNLWTGQKSFEGRSLHSLELGRPKNPYLVAIDLIGMHAILLISDSHRSKPSRVPVYSLLTIELVFSRTIFSSHVVATRRDCPVLSRVAKHSRICFRRFKIARHWGAIRRRRLFSLPLRHLDALCH